MWCQKYQQPLKRVLLCTPLRTCAAATIHTTTKLNNLKEIFAQGNDENVYTVRPNGFWMDKILAHESKKPIVNANAQPRKLIDKTMFDSYIEEYLPFKSDPALLDEYIFSDGKIRTGKLLEDLDALAGAIAYKHIDNGDPNAPPITVVTASVDRLDLFLPEAGIENYKLSGHVSYVGNSSIEIFIKAETVPEGERRLPKSKIENPENLGILSKNTVLATRFTMVAIDPATHKPVKVNPLKLTSPAEERLFEMAEANKKRKRRAAETGLHRQPPTPEERLDIHDIFLQYSQYTNGTGDDAFMNSQSSDEMQPLPSNLVWMRDTKIESNFLMQPQDRNLHNNIFGGYLMRRAYELAYANTALFMKTSSPTLLSMDEVTFRKPVHVGTLLNLRSGIVLSEGYPHRSVQVRVIAEVINIEKGTRETTNVFHFTLASGNDKVKLRRILPKTYAETMLWIDAKRRRFQGIHARHAMLEAGIEQH
ncbi:putative acyl-CoA hydrolase [Mucor mucedo]|uniref:Putative acyl-CoA hydrolase n=1 Tax=Mucor mucedo TaxID=29922 RepID=Q659U9_MUCMU|nr:putative acyl-CoA hydrolase [Mucor mucedo]KAI7880257.1 putative acyl-CoA hydrolase [Mucor mucedo]CAH40840.1 putative acyl-CoA hydrolase [Mucor mucedo]